jgi:hypothetical protein
MIVYFLEDSLFSTRYTFGIHCNLAWTSSLIIIKLTRITYIYKSPFEVSLINPAGQVVLCSWPQTSLLNYAHYLSRNMLIRSVKVNVNFKLWAATMIR